MPQLPGDGPVRTALVGYGSAGRGIHAPLLTATPGLTVTRVATSDPGRAAAARAELPGAQVDQDWDALARHLDEVDLVVLATPNPAHAEQALAAVTSGTAVVVDKPLALGAREARRVVDAAAGAGVPLTVFQNRRWDASHLLARAVLAGGELGRVLRYEARFERWRPQPKQRWREQLPGAAGGGLLLDLQSHLVDGAVDLFGPVATVYAELDAVSTPADDVTFLALRHTGGVVTHLGATSLAGAPGPHLRVLGTGAALVVDQVDDEARMTAPPSAGTEPPGWLVRGADRMPLAPVPGSWTGYYPAVVAWLRGEGPVPVDPRDAVEVLAVLDAARRSATTGSVVDLHDLDLPADEESP